MFDFKLSETLVRRILQNLKANEIALPRVRDDDIEQLRTAWGHNLAAAVGTMAQQTQHGVREGFSDSFITVADGDFPADIGNDIGGTIPIPEGNEGDAILRELASEFITYVSAQGASCLHPNAPVTRMEVVGSDVVIHVRPYVPPTKDPDFVRATVLE